ncbi:MULTISPECIES: TonB-dependent receptor [unclassified Sphingomonas]|uniref:TonB-dependent receptor plug domain-containing protein n=1 Tax=unclassified Sphingomonas TaxID=196159 RepID=UPI000FF66548|nr:MULTISPECIES: TonB-dependent receptor [unclassified Sphingomonas]RKE44669.1 TonB-dependent receptor-like protein [Sphingomonas sp. PP-CC-1A-547]TCM06262.1 TonB-dependent receptor-like protein [Sphingomonas sp. PP-CC-3G-468]
MVSSITTLSAHVRASVWAQETSRLAAAARSISTVSSPTTRQRRTLIAGSSSIAALILSLYAAPSFAQAAPAQTTDTVTAPEPLAETPRPAEPEAVRTADIIVTGSRIQSSGFTAPTPTTVFSEADIQNNAQPNVFTTIAQLPSLQGSSGSTTNTFSTSSGQQGLSSFSLRGLGTIRTLTLVDGQRVVGAYYTGVTDVSLLPQLLIKRVDIVNGGASASYGSDAVGGVVNFITDTHFQGFKGNIQGGITNYGDDGQGLIQLAAGRSYLNDRLHLVVSGEYAKEAGVGPGDFGTDLAGGRDWFTQTTMINRNVVDDGSPQYVLRDFAQPYNFTKYGLITAGPLQGTAFDQSGRPFQFQYGSNGVPARDNSGAVRGCLPGFCVGGDLSGNIDTGRTLQSAIQRIDSYGRIGYDFATDNEVYVSVNVGQVKTHNQPTNGANRPGLRLQCANPFVPASIQAACATAGITDFQFGASVAILPNTIVHTDRRQYRVVGGLKGKFDIGGSPWTYDAYYERGITDTAIDVDDIVLTPHFNQAIQAITLNGAIVCANPVARANGCIPLNIIGGATPSESARRYVQPENGPIQRLHLTQDVASLAFSGTPVELWAGPLSVAFGGEYRKEFYKVRADAYGAGVSAISPNTSEYPADPTLLTAGNNWYAGNYKNGTGAYDVKEAFLELDVPLFKSDMMGRANINGAARITDYSTSGRVWTWKIGGTWDTPLNGLRLRGVTSRDVRAPNLSELFAAPVTTTLPNFLDPARNVNVVAIQNAIGNPALTPEIARNTEVGAVYANPSWLPGFSASVDYYNIKVTDVISSLGAAQIVDLCFRNILPETCSAYNLNNTAGPNFINTQAFNLASIKTDGFDIEASYRWRRPLGVDGTFTLRGLATHIRKFVTDTGLPGTIPTDGAGVNLGATPRWKLLAVQAFSNDRFSLTVQERWFSDGNYGNQYVVCAPGTCPKSTTTAPTIDRNFMPGAFYLDVGGTYNITKQVSGYFKVDNVFDHDPAASPQSANPALYDIVGRIYRVGVRFSF